MVELEQLQMRVAQLKAQNEELMSAQTSSHHQEQHQTVGPDCEKILFQFVTRTSCGGCAIASWTCNNSWECPRIGEIVPSCGECSGGFVTECQTRQWSRTLSGVNEEVHRQCDRTALCTGDISVGIARSPVGGFQPGSQEEAPSC